MVGQQQEVQEGLNSRVVQECLTMHKLQEGLDKEFMFQVSCFFAGRWHDTMHLMKPKFKQEPSRDGIIAVKENPPNQLINRSNNQSINQPIKRVIQTRSQAYTSLPWALSPP